MNPESNTRGPIAWMAKNAVAANLFMFVLLLAGAFGLTQTKQEVLPEFDLDIISISVPYPGASPEEVEQGIVLVLEEAVRSIDGIKRVNSRVYEGVGSVVLSLRYDANKGKVLDDVKANVDRITTFPQDAEEPQISELTLRREVISLIISGDQELSTLHDLAEDARKDLRQHPDITQVDISGVPPREMSIEIKRATLEAYGLTLDDVARQIRAASLDLPAGGVKTKSGELLVRVSDRKKKKKDFENIILRSSLNGAKVMLGEIATIKDGYEDNDQASYFNGKRAVQVVVFRVGKETPIAVAKAVNDYAAELKTKLPDSIEISTWGDQSIMLKGRIALLVDNARVGLILVFGILALFLRLRLAFWVALGIPISFMGSFILLGNTDATINMISLFAYIVTLGLVVDDAIVVGENIYEEHEKGSPWLQAAIDGARQMVVPVTFAILTSIAAFSPLLVTPGVSGKFFRLIPLVVISVLILSLIESFFVLPAHLAHMKETGPNALERIFERPKLWVDDKLKRFTDGPFDRVLRFCITYRYSSFAVAIALFFVSVGLVGSGLVPFSFFPKLPGNKITVAASLPYGAPVEETMRVQSMIQQAAQRALEKVPEDKIADGMFASLGQGPLERTGAEKGSHLVTVQMNLVPAENRKINAEEFSLLWQQELPVMPEVESIKISSEVGPGGQSADIDVMLISDDTETLSQSSKELSKILLGFPSLKDIDNTYTGGKDQLDFQLKPEARSLGLTSNDVARQVRSAFFGVEALREQVGSQERKTMVRLPRSERENEVDVAYLRIKTPQGGYAHLQEVVSVKRGQAPTSIKREDGMRVVNVKANLATGVKSPQEALSALKGEIFPALLEKYPKLKVDLVGQQRDQAETFSSLGRNYLLALFAIYALLAIPFKSYIQPFIIMSAIPFGFVGAVAGHVIMQTGMSVISMFGIVALTGVVVNDSLVLIDSANQKRIQGADSLVAIVFGAKRRLRPILLTSLTTFLGLAPMIAETSIQAKFLIPMAISLGFGVLFATFIIVLVVPALYMIVEDCILYWNNLFHKPEKVSLSKTGLQEQQAK